MLLRKRIELVVIGVLIIGMIGYAVSSTLYSAFRVNSAEQTLNTVVSHQNSLNVTFGAINSQLVALNSSAAFDSAQALTLVDKSIANSQLAMNTINRDDASLRTAANNLNALPWLTLLGRGSLDRVATRIAHARKALAAARAIASDEMLDGRFWSVLYGGLADFTTLNTQSSAGDVAGARSTLVKMKAEIDQAAQLSGAPGLPADLHDLMADIQTFVGDYGNKLDAQAAGDDVAESTAETNVDTDVTEIGKYDIDKIGGEIDSFYKPMIDRFNSEIAAATA